RRAVQGRDLPHGNDLRALARRTQPLRGGVHVDGRHRARREHAPPHRRAARGHAVAATFMARQVADAPPIVAAVRRFVDKEVIPAASGFEHADAYPHQLVARMLELGPFASLLPLTYPRPRLPLPTS